MKPIKYSKCTKLHATHNLCGYRSARREKVGEYAPLTATINLIGVTTGRVTESVYDAIFSDPK
jgi:hypothetical protein